MLIRSAAFNLKMYRQTIVFLSSYYKPILFIEGTILHQQALIIEIMLSTLLNSVQRVL